LHSAFFYDVVLFFAWFGKEHKFRDRVLELARLTPGESVLDVGCGTGTLAIAAKKKVGLESRVSGVDASQEMIARAERKAIKARVEVQFRNALAEALPFKDEQFDVVLTTVMFHHMAPRVRELAANEIRRVLKPGGRVLVVDFCKPSARKKGLLGHFHGGHGHVKPEDLNALFTGSGLSLVESGALGRMDLRYVLSRREE
jgi:ubiquinone/menaquinone biosynthesis C-methylase UbiE